jgi:hypothetical protein
MLRILLLTTALGLAAPLATAQTVAEAPAPDANAAALMTPGSLNTILLELDPAAQVGPGAAMLTLDDVPVTVIHDPVANRLRALVPIASAQNLTEGQMLRLLQANFDTALDARYAVADGRVWSVYMHPLAELDRAQVISGLAQAVSLAQSYGTTFASTETMFMRGDSVDRLREMAEPDIDL